MGGAKNSRWGDVISFVFKGIAPKAWGSNLDRPQGEEENYIKWGEPVAGDS